MELLRCSPDRRSACAPRRGQRGQAVVEWIGLVLLIGCCGVAGLSGLGPEVDGRSFGGFLSHRLVCAVRGDCDDGDAGLARAYGKAGAALVRRHAPTLVYEPGEPSLPVDWRDCREPRCAAAPDDRDLDAHRTEAGRRATLFTHLVRRGGRRYIQYWLYYPDSNSTFAGSDRIWNNSPLRLAGRYPGFHEDDWEAYAVRVDRDGRVFARASAHGHWQACKQPRCRDRWAPATGWTRISRGSHAGHIPEGFPRERSSSPDGLRLVPLETLDKRGYRRLDPGISPPWRKPAWRDPERGGG